jgi:cytochrome P450
MSAAVPDTPNEIVEQLFTTPEGRRDPYPRYHRLRELEPVHYNEALDLWLLTTYDDCSASMRDPRLGKNYPRQMETQFGADWRKHPSLASFEHSVLNLDGPEHSRLRKLVVKSFTRRAVDRLRQAIEEAVDRYLDPYAEAGGGDLIEAIAFPMPITVIGELLGVPESDRSPFRGWVLDLTAVFEMQPSEEQLLAADAAQVTIRSYFDELIAEKRKRPDEGLISTLVHLESAGDRLTHDEIATMAQLVFIAGFETTTNLIGNGLYGLLQQPDQIELLRKDPALLPRVPDELLRYDGTAQMTVRNALSEIEIGGKRIPAGDNVYSVIAAGNHDPAQFHDPDCIDVTRESFRPLSFGGGAHFCLGASLARAEIEVTVVKLLERFTSIELKATPRYRDRLTLRGLEALDLAVVVGGEARVAARPRVTLPREEIIAAPSRALAQAPVGAVRPQEGTEADRDWRNALREQVESGANQALVRTGQDLAATIVLLARAPLFQSCKPDEIAELAATAYPITFEAGERLCVEGAESLECYVIQEGEADVTIRGEQVRAVGENDVVGERGVLEASARSATVTASTHMLTWAISRERLLALVEKNPDARTRMNAYMQERYRD